MSPYRKWYPPPSGMPSAQQAICIRFSCTCTHTRLQRLHWVKLYTSHRTSQTVIRLLQTIYNYITPFRPQIYQKCSSWGAQLAFSYLVFPRWWASSSGQPSRLFKLPLQHERTNLASVADTFILLLQHVLTKKDCRVICTRVSFKECSAKTQNKPQTLIPRSPHETPAALRHGLLRSEKPCTLIHLLLPWGLASWLPSVWQPQSHTAQENKVGSQGTR